MSRISEELLQELRGFWIENGHSLLEVIAHIREKLGLETKEVERLVLFGRRFETTVDEEIAGYLVAIDLDVVLFQPIDQSLASLSGLLERTNDGSAIFLLRPFSSTSSSASLYIYPSSFPEGRRRRYNICPTWVSWQIGVGMGESYSSFGIDPDRWNKTLKPWLEKWLPPTTSP